VLPYESTFFSRVHYLKEKKRKRKTIFKTKRKEKENKY